MATCQFEDLTGSIDVLVFPKTFIRYREMIQKDTMVLIKGRYMAQDDNPKVSADEILPLPSDAQWAAQKARGSASAVPEPPLEQPSYSQYERQPIPSISAAAPKVASLQEVADRQAKKLYLRLSGKQTAPQVQQQLKLILRKHHGPMPVYFYFSDEKRMVLAEYQYWVNSEIDLIMALSQLLGAENISVKEAKQEA